ncbi:putative T6SS immunity periplasmic lipoprotein [Erwinia sp. 9145]|uniref:putative T6SS immunity periplasmic lipoprotein n=1 Tax=Erwinia sp. 9145 TaxID=1500895 RepID=UPI00054FC1C1|nr:putative T6SS immunity periplasmic lipoprotein [Erwinia sp. 9145]
MKIKYVILVTIFLLAGCHLERPWFTVMKVRIENNQPCFLIPENAARADETLQSHGVMVERHEGGKWQVISPPSTTSPVRNVRAGECTRWEGTTWTAGEYSALMRVDNISTENTVRYAVKFYLTEDASGQLSVINK